MSTKNVKAAVDAFFAALPASEEEAANDALLLAELNAKIAFHEGKYAAVKLIPLMESLVPLMRRHEEKINDIGNIILEGSRLTAERITRRIEGCELPPSANHFIHHTGNPDDLITLLTSGTEAITDIHWKRVSPEEIERKALHLQPSDISLLTYALKSNWVTPNQAWDTISRSSETSNTIRECLLLASKLTDLNYGDATLIQVVNGMRHAHAEWGIRDVFDPLDLSTDEKLNQNASIARATILASGEDSRYGNRDSRLIRNRRTKQQTMEGIQLHEMAVELYNAHPQRHSEITECLLVEGNSIMRVSSMLTAV